ncbi:ABC transporter permease, partial [Desulfotalea psychrophila]|nr:ABC transporter permease [Desulfotalea psychrophila]
MDIFLDSLESAFLLLLARDPELLDIVAVSLKVSTISTLVASLVGIPCGFLIAYSSFYGKRLLLTCLNTLLALPTVVIGLLVYSFISRQGLLGSMELLYTQKAIIIGQVILIIPLVTSLTIAAVSRIDKRYRNTALTLGATQLQMAWVIIKEARYGIGAAVIASFGRVIAEVGISM